MTFIYFQVLCSYGQIRRGLLLNNLTDRFAMSAENIICIVPLCRSPPDWPERSERCVDGAVEHRGQRCRRRGRRRGRQQRRCRAHSTSWFPRHTCVHARYSRSLDLKVTPCAVLLGSMMCLLCEYPSLLVAEYSQSAPRNSLRDGDRSAHALVVTSASTASEKYKQLHSYRKERKPAVGTTSGPGPVSPTILPWPCLIWPGL